MPENFEDFPMDPEVKEEPEEPTEKPEEPIEEPEESTEEPELPEINPEVAKIEAELAALEMENQKLKETLKQLAQPKLTKEQLEELEELKHIDVDEWYRKKKEYEEQAAKEVDVKLKETLEKVQEEIAVKAEILRRKKLVEEFNEKSPVKINDDTIEELPVRLVSKLEKGEIDFEDFLYEAAKYLMKEKKIMNPQAPNDIDFGKARGTSEPVETSKSNEDFISMYKNSIF